MKQYRGWFRWLAISPLFVLAFPLGAAPSPAPASVTPAPAGRSLPLKGPLTLDSGKIPAVGPPSVSYFTLSENLQSLNALFQQYRQKLEIMKSQVAACRKRTYSVEDQQKAGCTATDTVDQCREKLLHHCMTTGPFLLNTQNFRQTAQNVSQFTPTMIDQLQKALARVKYEADHYDFD